MAKKAVLASQSEDFPRWYQDVLTKAELAENGPVRGTMVIRPYGYAIWEFMQADLDGRIKAAGAQNVYMPLFIPESYLQREAEHVEGFSPELAVVTHAGGADLQERVVVRPTSETVFGEYMAKWVQSYRDLPLLLNQWANVVRWELRPRIFLRTTEFLWQEGHTAHRSDDDAQRYATRILHEVYAAHMRDVLAIPVVTGIKPPSERFAGATNTMTCEAMMADGKALQMGTSHELGQNFARAFGIGYLDAAGAQQVCWTTSWGVSTRMVGGVIMCHGDDHGLRLPPTIAPHQVVVIQIGDDAEIAATATKLAGELAARGHRVHVDDRTEQSFGRRATEWEIKGVPVRVEIGARDLDAGAVPVTARLTKAKQHVPVEQLAPVIAALLDESQTAMLNHADQRQRDRTHDVSTVADALEASETGWARIPWDIAKPQETTLNSHARSVRCLTRPDGSMPRSDTEPELLATIARAY